MVSFLLLGVDPTLLQIVLVLGACWPESRLRGKGVFYVAPHLRLGSVPSAFSAGAGGAVFSHPP